MAKENPITLLKGVLTAYEDIRSKQNTQSAYTICFASTVYTLHFLFCIDPSNYRLWGKNIDCELLTH